MDKSNFSVYTSDVKSLEITYLLEIYTNIEQSHFKKHNDV